MSKEIWAHTGKHNDLKCVCHSQVPGLNKNFQYTSIEAIFDWLL